MNLSTQLRIILLLAGAAIWLAIYLYGKRKAAQPVAAAPALAEPPQQRDATPGFTPAEETDDDEFETPAYMRRQGQREPRQDYEPRIATAHDYVNMDEVRDDHRQFGEDNGGRLQVQAAYDVPELLPQASYAHPARGYESPGDLQQEPVYTDAGFEASEPNPVAPLEPAVNEPVAAAVFPGRREPTIGFDEFEVADRPVTDGPEPAPLVPDDPVRAVDAEPPTMPNIPVVEHPVDAAHGYARRTEPTAGSASNAAPTLSEAVPAPAERTAARAPDAAQGAAATSAAKPSGTAPRRKIIALRLLMPERVAGAQLLSLLQGERLQHGKFSIFHRLQHAGTVFSVASMVEPGTFDLQAMSEQQFPGVTLFMLLPGPVDGLVAWDQMLSCAQRIAHATGGVLQDERGGKLTPQTLEKLREEVLDFQHLIGATATTT